MTDQPTEPPKPIIPAPPIYMAGHPTPCPLCHGHGVVVLTVGIKPQEESPASGPEA